MNLSEHFSLEEMTHSEWAARHGVDNTPTPEALANLKHICPVYLEPIRHWLEDFPIIVTSGYRSRIVNSAVGGSPQSSHLLGLAVDFICPAFGTPLEICYRLEACFKHEKIAFDQIIYEYSWVHVGFKEPMRNNRLTVNGNERKWGWPDA